LSSTTDRRSAEGQIVVIFAGALLTICLIAALVFDVGQNLLDRRSEQNAADAAALAGARYIVGVTYTYHGLCSAGPFGTKRAVQAACDVAAANGYTDGIASHLVQVDIPPVAPSTFNGIPGHVEVTIRSSRASFFAGVIGNTVQKTGADAVATNASDIALPYSLLALDPTGCGTNKINGSPGTIVTTNGTVHVDSSCPTDAILLSGNGVLSAPECDVVGTIKTQGGAVNSCTAAPTGVLAAGDPLRNLPPPAEPAGAPANVQPLDGGPIPSGCPGNARATDAAPATCSFSGGPTKDHVYRIFPGTYPGGIFTSNATVYMEPGLYWIGGGGVTVKSSGGDGKLISKATGDNTGTNPTGGVLIYNSRDPLPVSGCTGVGCYASVQLNGGSGAILALAPIQTGLYKNMVMFVDRGYPVGTNGIDLNGGGSVLNVTGTIYAPTVSVQLNGSATDTISAQVICYNFQVNGSGASFTLDFNPGKLFHLKGVGLVQ
jgi:hypothetical protein